MTGTHHDVAQTKDVMLKAKKRSDNTQNYQEGDSKVVMDSCLAYGTIKSPNDAENKDVESHYDRV